jgi:hypothetical protein
MPCSVTIAGTFPANEEGTHAPSAANQAISFADESSVRDSLVSSISSATYTAASTNLVGSHSLAFSAQSPFTAFGSAIAFVATGIDYEITAIFDILDVARTSSEARHSRTPLPNSKCFLTSRVFIRLYTQAISETAGNVRQVSLDNLVRYNINPDPYFLLASHLSPQYMGIWRRLDGTFWSAAESTPILPREAFWDSNVFSLQAQKSSFAYPYGATELENTYGFGNENNAREVVFSDTSITALFDEASESVFANKWRDASSAGTFAVVKHPTFSGVQISLFGTNSRPNVAYETSGARAYGNVPGQYTFTPTVTLDGSVLL